MLSSVRQSNISAIENDRRVPSADTLNRLVVACGYELTATAGRRTIACPLPMAGWFPDEDTPPAHPDDPVDERPAVGPRTPMRTRARVLTAILHAVDATFAHERPGRPLHRHSSVHHPTDGAQ